MVEQETTVRRCSYFSYVENLCNKDKVGACMQRKVSDEGQKKCVYNHVSI